MNPSRLVSIAIPANTSEFFEASLRSAFSQTHDPIEIVICDDCEDDAIAHIVERLAPQSPWPIRYLRNEKPLGETLNLARCISESQGEYVKFLCGNDLMDPTCISQLFELLEGHPHVTLASSRRNIINELSEIQPDTWVTCFPFAHDVIFSGLELAAFLGQFPVNFIGELSCVMCRRADVTALGNDLMALNGTPIASVGDLSMYVKLLRQGDLAMRFEPLSSVRVSDAPERAQAQQNQEATASSLAPFKQCMAELGWSSDLDEYRMVKVALLNDRQHFIDVDLRAYFVSVNPDDQLIFNLGRWMNLRTVSARQQLEIDDYLAAHEAGSSLLLVVRSNGAQRQDVVNTLQSILAHRPLCAALNIVVLSNEPPPGSFQQSAELLWQTAPLDVQANLLNRLLDDHHSDWFMLLEAGDIFTPQGLSRMRLALTDHPCAWALYADQLHRTEAGQLEPILRPDFNLDYLLSLPSVMSGHWLFNRRSTLDVGGFDEQLPDALELDLILRMIENDGIAHLQHLAEPTLICNTPTVASNDDHLRALTRHLHARGYLDSQIQETAPGHYRIRYNHEQRPLVSILIPTKDQLGILSRCVESVLEKTAYSDYEIIIIDNNSEEPDALEWLAGVESMQNEKVRVLRHPFPFNYSEINNTAARHARGEYLVLLNNDTAVLHEDWLDNLLNHALRPEVGIVGAKLYYPDSAIQHAGVVLGIDAPALHVFLGAPQHSAGYMQRLTVDQNYSAVTAACLMIRKSLYEEVGGLDDVNFKVSFNDIDLCLKVRVSGYLVVWTPHVQLLHESSVSQVQTDKTANEKKVTRFRGEQLAMYRKWLPIMAADPAYNRNFALVGNGFEVEPNVDLTWRPLPWRPQPVVLAHRRLRWNDGDRRISTPLNALRELNLLDGAVSARPLFIAEIERLRPDAIVFQRPFSNADLNSIELIQELSPATRILDLDRLPTGYRDDPLFISSLERVNRVVVSSSRLANALEGLHSDIRVVADYLPVHWQQVQREPGTQERMRVGWRGDHEALDLELLGQIMAALSDEVDFVVMGWCPVALRPFVKEQRPQVQAALYPDALAQMNLDLALLPLPGNELQGCQSIARLLEFGACGFPVMCSAGACDEGQLPVTRLPNVAQVWIDTIRAHILDAHALKQQGDTLQREVRERWTLSDSNLQVWRNAWLG